MKGPAVWEGLLDLLFPPKCPFCRRLLPARAALWCGACQRTLPWTSGPLREQRVEFTAGCVSPLYYRDTVRDSLHRYKFHNCTGYAELYGLLMAQAVRDTWPDTVFDAVTWVPLSRRRRRRRGYDQAMLLARALSQRLSLPVEPTLRKTRHTPAQSGQPDHGARRVNVMNAYQARPDADLRGKTLLLCDDVVTTGATLSECARMLRMAGAEKVYAVTLARGTK